MVKLVSLVFFYFSWFHLLLFNSQNNMNAVIVIHSLDWKLGKISFLKEWSGIGTGCPGGGEVTIPGGVQNHV